MGWVSTLEDIVTRLETSLHMAKEAKNNDLDSPEEKLRRAQQALKDAESIAGRIWKLLDDATAPEMNAAYQVEQLRNENGELQWQIKQLVRGKASKDQQISSLKEQNQKLRSDLKVEKQRAKKAEKDFNRLAEKAPGAAMDLFSSDGMIAKCKPSS